MQASITVSRINAIVNRNDPSQSFHEHEFGLIDENNGRRRNDGQHDSAHKETRTL
jgi:hypothetical protein